MAGTRRCGEGDSREESEAILSILVSDAAGVPGKEKMTDTVPASSCLAAAVVVIPISSSHYCATRRVATLTRRRRRRRPSNPPPRGTRGLRCRRDKTKDASAYLVEPQPVAKSLPLRRVHVPWHAGDLDGYAPRVPNGAPPLIPIQLTREGETPHVSSGIIERRVHFSFVAHL